MSGIIEQRDVGAGHLVAEFPQGAVEAGLVEVKPGAAADHEEAERQQRVRHQSGVGRGIWQRRHRTVGRIADHQRHAFFGMCRRAHGGAHQKCRDHQSRHDADPTSHGDALHRQGPFPPPIGLARPVFGSTAGYGPSRRSTRG
jgi:hypothetical protein